jgi:hypothetical protein
VSKMGPREPLSYFRTKFKWARIRQPEGNVHTLINLSFTSRRRHEGNNYIWIIIFKTKINNININNNNNNNNNNKKKKKRRSQPFCSLFNFGVIYKGFYPGYHYMPPKKAVRMHLEQAAFPSGAKLCTFCEYSHTHTHTHTCTHARRSLATRTLPRNTTKH